MCFNNYKNTHILHEQAVLRKSTKIEKSLISDSRVDM